MEDSGAVGCVLEVDGSNGDSENAAVVAMDVNQQLDCNNGSPEVRNGDDVQTSQEVLGGKLSPPEVGMSFDVLDELFEYYRRYAEQEGFSIVKASKTNDANGEHKYQKYTCHSAGKPSQRGSNCLKPNASKRCHCRARVTASHGVDGRWKVNTVVLEHNHPLTPGKSQYLQRHRLLAAQGKRNFELDDPGVVRPCKSIRMGLIENADFDKVTSLIPDCREKIGRLHLEEGDAQVLRSFFERMQHGSHGFFFTFDCDEEGRLRNVFWIDARSKAAYQEFGDVVTFDTTYLLNKYRVPIASFVGVNNHGQLILLGCALISTEDVETYVWLFKTWVNCMSDCHPSTLITDQCKSIERAAEIVLPYSTHRWCLWHILTKFPEKMCKYGRYNDLKEAFMETVYDSFSIEEFEQKWAAMVDEYALCDNEWFCMLYEGKDRWVPIFEKDAFWAGMSCTQRTESVNSFFDGYMSSRSTLKHFIEHYETALTEKINKEMEADVTSINCRIPCVTHFEWEKQFQLAYTNEIFRLVQQEVTSVMYCEIDNLTEDGHVHAYNMSEKRMLCGGRKKQCHFKVLFNPMTTEVSCNCRLFELKGILCRHAFRVLAKIDAESIPSKYELRRWRKDVSRCHSKIKVGSMKHDTTSHSRMLRELEKVFYNVVDMATESTNGFNLLRKAIEDCGKKLESWPLSR